MERLAAGPRRAGMFAGGNRHCHLAGGALRRPGRGVAAARRVVLGGGRICRRAGRCGVGRRGHRTSVARGVPLRGIRSGRYAAGRGRGRAEVPACAQCAVCGFRSDQCRLHACRGPYN